jgi:hypothetical protein
MLRGQEGYNFFARPNFVRGAGSSSSTKYDSDIRRAATQTFIEHAVHMINLTRPQEGGALTVDQERTVREIRDIGDWNRFGFELLSDATRYGILSLDTGELTCFRYSKINVSSFPISFPQRATRRSWTGSRTRK